MKIAIMQPYLFPFIGYFQLIKVVDSYVIFDDVNYISKGWINRNRILLKGKEYMFTLLLSKPSQNKLINEVFILDGDKSKKRLIATLRHSYSKAPQYAIVSELLTEIILNSEEKLSKYIEYSLIKILDFLDIRTQLLFSSDIAKNKSPKGQDKILEICKILGATEYINPIGGRELYDEISFKVNGIKLYFLKTKDIKYKQFNNNFIQNLSIIDVMMFNSKNEVKKLLNEYKLI